MGRARVGRYSRGKGLEKHRVSELERVQGTGFKITGVDEAEALSMYKERPSTRTRSCENRNGVGT
jgi:hypothetical protein